MDYVVGSVAALISGNVTPNRPKLIRRALTPTKHQPSPNVTPKSEMVEDRSIFLSPTLQKKKAIIKKSPKRIFENPDLDATENSGDNSLSSPKAEKVKKHLKNELESEGEVTKVQKSPKSKHNNKSTLNEITQNNENMEPNFSQSNETTPKKNKKRKLQSDAVEVATTESENLSVENISSENDSTPVKSKKSPKRSKDHKKSIECENESMETDQVSAVVNHNTDVSDSKKTKNNSELSLNNTKDNNSDKLSKSQKKRLKKKLKLQMKNSIINTSNTGKENNHRVKEIGKDETRNKKEKKVLNKELNSSTTNENISPNINQNENQDINIQNKSKKKNKKKSKIQQEILNKENHVDNENSLKHDDEIAQPEEKQSKKSKNKIKNTETSQSNIEKVKTSKKKNPQSNINKDNDDVQVTDKKSHQEKKKNFVNPNAITDKDSDSEHESDNEIDSETEKINEKVLEENNSDQSSDEEDKEDTVKEKKTIEKVEHKMDADEIKRTLFVGNVPFSAKCKKQIKKIFNKYGKIETVRIRTVPIKDARVTPKLAVIKNELHPERTTVNMYIKYADPESVEKALVENNTMLEENHLRVTRSGSTGAEHDPRLAIFIGNLPFAIEDDTLRAKFEKCGEIESVRIIRDKKTNAGKGFGYVNFASKDGVELALALSEEDLTIKNRILRVKRCTQVTHRQTNRQINPKWGPEKEEKGAFRRLMHKRKIQDGNTDGPPNKRANNLKQPTKEKKTRKEFVGMTSEKKKKRKFDKGQKKKKVLSQILANKS